MTIARPYAKAVFELAQQHNDYSQWSLFLNCAALVIQDTRVTSLLHHPKLSIEDKVTFITDICKPSITEHNKNFLFLLAQNNKLELLPEIKSRFETLRLEHEKQVNVLVKTATDLSPAQEKQLKTALEKKLSRTVTINFEIQPDLIGGFYAKAGDWVFDGSVKHRLVKLSQALLG